MKTKRQAQILELINDNYIETQEELLLRLKERGYKVTQATVSRDIKEMRLLKTLSPDGKYHYTTAAKNTSDGRADFRTFFTSSVVSVKSAQNIIVIKTTPGMAQGVCTSLDMMNYAEILGTIAGDDTIFAVSTDADTALEFTKDLKKLL